MILKSPAIIKYFIQSNTIKLFSFNRGASKRIKSIFLLYSQNKEDIGDKI
jgi:hypothetical protein